MILNNIDEFYILFTYSIYVLHMTMFIILHFSLYYKSEVSTDLNVLCCTTCYQTHNTKLSTNLAEKFNTSIAIHIEEVHADIINHYLYAGWGWG